MSLRVLLCAALISIAVAACDLESGSRPADASRLAASTQIDDAARQAALKQQAEIEQIAATEECKSSLSAKTAEYRKRMAAREYLSAANSLRRCSQLLADAKIKAMVKDAEVRSYVSELSNGNASAANRLKAMDRLTRDYPDAAKKYEKDRAKISALASAERQEREFSGRFQRPIRIGDSESQVMSVGWGAPSKVNRTTTAAGVQEQWVYEGNRFLYFDNGRLTAIQE